jgi:hypothetical protein
MFPEKSLVGGLYKLRIHLNHSLKVAWFHNPRLEVKSRF